jgi:ankyrin repeat protein
VKISGIFDVTLFSSFSQGLQQLLMEEQNLVNHKDFIHGYTALHWAAKHGRCDIIAGLMLNGAQVDIKSV